MQLSYLEEFVALSNSKSLADAAKKLYLSRPSLSEHLAKMEEELGVRLVQLEGGLSLTAAGVVLLDFATRTLREYGDVKVACAQLACEDRPRLRIMTADSEAADVAAYRSCTDGEIVLVEHDFNRPIFSQLANGECDVLFTYDLSTLPDDERAAEELGLVHAPVQGGRMAFACMASNPLADGPLTFQKLRGATVYVANAVHYTRTKLLLDALGDGTLGFSYELHNAPDRNDLLLADFGEAVFVCSESTARRYLGSRTDVKVFDEVDGEALYFKQSVVSRSDARPQVTDFVARYRALKGR